MTTDSLLLFIVAGLLLNLTPGPDVLYIVSHALRSGARAGIAAAFGITAGCFVHISAAAVGVSALMAASATAFAALKWLGATYLVYVGLRLLTTKAGSAIKLEADCSDSKRVRSQGGGALCSVSSARCTGSPFTCAERSATLAPDVAPDYKTIFLRGFWTNALNPKVALFFLAFVPQFIAPTVEHKPLAFLLLGLLFNFNGLWVNLGWAVTAAWLAGRARLVQKSLHWLDRIAGTMFVAFGIKLALTESPHA